MVVGVLPEVFRKSPGFQVNFSWADTLQGQGYVRFYPTIGVTSATGDASTTYINSLCTETTDGNTDHFLFSYGTSNAAYQTAKDLDFDLLIKAPVTLKGKTNINVTISGTSDTGGQPCYMYVKATIYHVSTGAVETSIGTADSVRCTGTNGAERYHRLNIPVTITEKNFGIGETLRLNLIWYMKSANGVAAVSGYIYCDPESGITYTDLSGRTIGSDITFDVPFKIDL